MSVCLARRAVTYRVAGAVQGVGFRPFVFRLANDLRLDGWILNDGDGVTIRVEGGIPALEEFRRRIETESPPAAKIVSITGFESDATFEDRGFTIRESDTSQPPRTTIMTDLATCPDCLREILDPKNRRHRYPFTNCTNCGPRFSIVTAIPYDRPNTTMVDFEMCSACRAEYENPADRRFHAQPNACPDCGPKLMLWNERGETIAEKHEAMLAAAAAIRAGRIVAVKGLGGFHLVCDARSDDSVRQLRRRKHREEKPLAIMFPDLESIAAACEVGRLERDTLTSIQSPIVLLQKSQTANHKSPISELAAPSNPMLGAMLPYTPLHHLLIRELGFPIIATSGNLSEEPICTDEGDALNRLHDIADAFLIHNRRIARPVDDSVVRATAGRIAMIRRSRGFAPMPVARTEIHATVLAAGGQLKNAVALATAGQIYVSQHVGDLATEKSVEAFEEIATALPALYDTVPHRIACDLHPDYASTVWAKKQAARMSEVQHHHAHILSVMAEHDLRGEVLGVSWDGTGFGTDGTIWGGEFLVANERGFKRAAHFRPFPLPGGEVAVREPRRCALGLMFAAHGDAAFENDPWSLRRLFTDAEWATLHTMLKSGINCPMTSSAGRLFDAVASLLGIRQRTAYEGQAAMLVEFAAHKSSAPQVVGPVHVAAPVIDWQPVTEAMADATTRFPLVGTDRDENLQSLEVARLAAQFHDWLVAVIVAVAKRTQLQRVCLGGGCFQNARLLEGAIGALRASGFEVFWPREVPSNDGGLALGQAWFALNEEERK